jgi:hypothetical protein
MGLNGTYLSVFEKTKVDWNIHKKKVFLMSLLIKHIHVDLKGVLLKECHVTIFPHVRKVAQRIEATWSTFLA